MAQWHLAVSFAFLLILSLSLVPAPGLDNPYLPIVKPAPLSVSNGTLSVNNSQYLRGYSPIGLRNLFQLTYDTLYCELTGCTMTGDIDMGANDITNVNDITITNDAQIDDELRVDGQFTLTDNMEILGNYFIKWLDNAGTNTYAYIMANAAEFKLSAVSEAPMNFYYGNLGSLLGASMNGTTGNWNFTNNVTSQFFIGDGSFLTGLSGAGLWTNVSGVATYAGPVNITTDGYLVVGDVITGTITEDRIFSEGTIVSHSGFSSKNTGWEPYLKIYSEDSVTIKKGINGEFDDSENMFCDYTANNFTASDASRPTKVLTLTSGTYIGAVAEVNSYINSSCIILEKNPGWDADTTSTWNLKTGLKVNFNDGEAYKFVVGNDPASLFKIGVPNGTGFTGAYIYDVAGADQHQALTIDVDSKDYDGVVGLNIFMSSSTGVSDIFSNEIRLEGDATGFNNSKLGFIGVNLFGSGLDNDIDIIAIDGLPSEGHIIHAGSPDTISKAYYDNTATITDVTTAFSSMATNTALFENDNSIVYVSGAVNFTTIGFSLDTESSRNLRLEYYYCNSADNWVTLNGVSDTTNGMRVSGSISFTNPTDRGTCNDEIDGTAFANTTDYTYIAIKRTRNNVNTPPIENSVSIAGGGDTFLMALDYMKMNPVDTSPEICDIAMLGAIYFDISEDDMCQCASGGWEVIRDGSDCT